ncbi:MAG: hypothetical protein AVO35_06280 [Candidatus Aegiribacteria sp. MLS_C]|nr:MAG: hypothetical protein AVO35_06280 [Candidatus Aegiribacteria sp. MLS_C]
MPSIRYQVMAMEEELGGPMTITAVSWLRSYEGDSIGVEYDFRMYMGLLQQDDLLPEFDQNYDPGTRQLVFQSDSLLLEGEAWEWLTIQLQEPFQYPGTGNLVIELTRSDAYFTNLFCFRWYTHEYRTVLALRPNETMGYANTVAAMLRIDYVPTGLSRMTWPAVKSLFLVN